METKILMVTASLILLCVPGLYLYKTIKGQITPNPVTFGVRSVVSLMNLVTYFFTTGQDPFKSTVTFASTLGLITIFVYAYAKGLTSKVNKYDKATGAIAILAAIVWKMSSNPVVANICLQAAMLLPFVPHIRGVLAGVAKEKTLPWALATLSYVLMTIALYLNQETTLQQFVHPVCVGILGNGLLALAVAYKNNKR